MGDKNVKLSLSEDGRYIVISGDGGAISRDRRMMASLKRIDPGYDPAAQRIEIGDRELHVLLLNLQDAFSKRGYVSESDEGAAEALKKFFEEEKAFSEFSQKARRIRNNDCDIEDFENFETVVAKNLPGRALYPLQLLSAYHLAFSQNACNFSVPGAGKTTIVYAAYSYLKECPDDSLKQVEALVVVGPLSSFQPWEDEYESCFLHAPTVMRLDGSISLREKKSYLLAGAPADLTLISYATLDSIRDSLQDFMSRHKTMLVLDEAHKVKNTDGGIWATASLSIAKTASSRVVLTGTPAPNGYEDLYNLFEFIWPGRNVTRFQVNQLADMSKNEMDDRIPRLLGYLEPFYLRIRKTDLNLPPVVNVPLDLVNLSPLQRKIYDSLEQQYLEPLLRVSSDDAINRGNALARIVRLMQATSNPKVLLEISDDPDSSLDLPESLVEDIKLFTKTEVPAKFEECRRLVEEIVSRGDKVIIWTNFVSTLLSFRDYLASQSVRTEVLYGGTPTGDFDESDEIILRTRESIIREFNDLESDLRVVIANPAAVAESISLHHACHSAVYLERGFNAAHYIQSRDRIHRYGLADGIETTYFRIAARGTIDEIVDERLKLKEERMMRVVESSDIPLFYNVDEELGSDDIKALIRDYIERTNKL